MFPKFWPIKNILYADRSMLAILKLRREKALSKRKRKERARKKERKKHRDNEDEVERQDGKDKDDKSTDCQGEMDNPIGRKHKNPGLANSTLTKELQGSIIPASDCSHKFVEEKSSTSSSQVMLTSNPHRVNSECDKDLGGCLMGKSEFDPNVNPETPISTSSESGMLEIESEYRNLIVNWAPPPLQLRMVQTEFEDEEWLSKKNPSTSTKRTQTKQVSSDTDTYQGIQTHARYLPDADIYALPYTLPF